MKSLHLTLCAMPLLLAGYSTLSSVNWSAASPWNWFGSPTQVTEQGVGALTGATPLDEKAITDALDGDYRLYGGVKTDNGSTVRFYEAMKDDKLAIVINGSQGIIGRIDVLDHNISPAAGAEIGTPFNGLYTKAFGSYQKAAGDDNAGVKCKAEGSQHIGYILSGGQGGPEDIIPSDNTLRAQKVSKIIWRRQFASEQVGLLKKQVEQRPSMSRYRGIFFSGETMPQIQSGILPEHYYAAIWIEANVKGGVDALRATSKTFADRLAIFEAKFPDTHLGTVVAFGNSTWRALSGGVGAEELKDFIPYDRGLAPTTQYDVLIHILSLRHDVDFSVTQTTMETFGDCVEVKEEIHDFRWVEEHNLSGFIDDTENPAGEETCREVAVIRDGADISGGYVFVQRWEHSLEQLSHMSIHDQEMMIGHTKEVNEEISGDDRPVTSHLSRADLKEDGKELKIVRQNLPYGTASGTHSLYFCIYHTRLHNIGQQLLSVFGSTDGKRDAMLRFTKLVTGGYYFAPSLDCLMAL